MADEQTTGCKDRDLPARSLACEIMQGIHPRQLADQRGNGFSDGVGSICSRTATEMLACIRCRSNRHGPKDCSRLPDAGPRRDSYVKGWTEGQAAKERKRVSGEE